MRRRIVLSFACASVMFSVAITAQAVTGRAVGVSDGDTITCSTLTSINAPESGQAFGRRSKQTLADCAFGKQATLIGDKVDRYGRTVSKVMVAGVDCNLRQVVLGQAWHYKAYEREQSAPDRDAHANAELDARKARSGLWADAKPVPPWEWRNGDGPGSHKSEEAAKESSGQCDCATSNVCVGKRGSEYCLTASGSKKYMR